MTITSDNQRSAGQSLNRTVLPNATGFRLMPAPWCEKGRTAYHLHHDDSEHVSAVLVYKADANGRRPVSLLFPDGSEDIIGHVWRANPKHGFKGWRYRVIGGKDIQRIHAPHFPMVYTVEALLNAYARTT